MTTELDNQNNLQAEQKLTEEKAVDSTVSNESEVDQPLAQAESTNPIDTEEDSRALDKENNPATIKKEDTTEEQSLEIQEDSSAEIVTSEESLDFEAKVSNEAETKILALQTEIENLKTELEAKNKENQLANSQYLRLTADFENFRRRNAKEKEDLEQQIKRKTLSELLSVVDNFERARTQIKPANDGEMAIHKSYQGVYKTLVDSLKRIGVSAMRPEGKPFDPNYHEAMLREPTNEHPEGTVLEQMVRGYLLNDQVLRHAMVKVSMPKDDGEETLNYESESVESESSNND